MPASNSPASEKKQEVLYFRLLAGVHVDKTGTYYGRGRDHGDVIKSTTDLAKLHGTNKFHMISVHEYNDAIKAQREREEELAVAGA